MSLIRGISKNGMFKYVSITKAHLGETLNLLHESFFKNEAISVAIGLDKVPAAIQELDELMIDIIKDGMSVIAIEKDTGTVVGCALNKIWIQKQLSGGNFNSFNFKYEESRRFHEINSVIDQELNFFEILETDCYVEPMIGTVLARFRKNNLTTEMMKVSMQQAQRLREGKNVRVSLNGKLLSPTILPTALVGIPSTPIVKHMLDKFGYITHKTLELQVCSETINVTGMYKYLV